MWPLARRLRAAGFATRSVAWRPRRDGVAATARALHRQLAGSGPRPTRFVGHSLGGRLALALAGLEPDAGSRVVTLGTPFGGSLAGTRLGRWAPGRWLLGRAAADVAGPWREGVPERCELGILAGTTMIGLGRLVTRVAGPGDGTVRLDETHLEGCADRLELPVTHFGFLASRRAADAVADFLREGKFPVKLHDR